MPGGGKELPTTLPPPHVRRAAQGKSAGLHLKRTAKRDIPFATRHNVQRFSYGVVPHDFSYGAVFKLFPYDFHGAASHAFNMGFSVVFLCSCFPILCLCNYFTCHFYVGIRHTFPMELFPIFYQWSCSPCFSYRKVFCDRSARGSG